MSSPPATGKTCICLKPGRTAQFNSQLGGLLVGGEHGVGVIFNVLDVKLQTPLEIIPHHILRRAFPEEVQIIQSLLPSPESGLSLRTAFEGQWNEGWRRNDNPDDWRYWVIAVTSTKPGEALNDVLMEIEEASRLSSVELIIPVYMWEGMVAVTGLTGTHPIPAPELSFSANPITSFSKEDVEEILKIHGEIKALDKVRYGNIKRAIELYHQLNAIPRKTPLYLLGLFAILESMLTHNPKGNSRTITHQISSKMSLLHRRFSPMLDASAFGNGKISTIWEKLYEYRSAVAHGSKPDFTDDLQILKNADLAADYVERAVKAVLRYAFKESQLISDLQSC